MPSPEIIPPPETDPVVELGEQIRYLADSRGRKNFVTFLIGAGFSRSAGVPVAGEIVKELREDKKHPFLKNAGAAPSGMSEYAFLMEKLGSPAERADYVKKFINRARDEKGRLRINWSHLLLAALVEKGYVNRILTTNFDPLIVEALAVMGQEIRTYDLSTTGKYLPGTLDPASVIYLHGQMHSLFLANSKDEMAKLRELYPSVLQEAVQDSILIVVGYSGECDPVLESLVDRPKFPRGVYWAHHSRTGRPPGAGVDLLRSRHGSDCRICTGCDSDTFMRKLVLEGMKLDLPDEVLKPITAMRLALERITPFPTQDTGSADPVQGALDLLRRMEPMTTSPTEPATVKQQESAVAKPAQPTAAETVSLSTLKSTPEEVSESAQALPIKMAALKGNWVEFYRLTKGIEPNPASILSKAVGAGLVSQASAIRQSEPLKAIALLQKAVAFGLDSVECYWLSVTWGDALALQAKLKGATPEADALFGESKRKYDEAIRTKADHHVAWNNWGATLCEQAALKGATSEAAALFAESERKCAESLRIKPDYHLAFINWGRALAGQAKLREVPREAEVFLAKAGQKYAEAVRLSPDSCKALNSWATALAGVASLKGKTPAAETLLADAEAKLSAALKINPKHGSTLYNLACLHALRGEPEKAVSRLQQWQPLSPKAQKCTLDRDTDFDRIRTDLAFIAFRETLPD